MQSYGILELVAELEVAVLGFSGVVIALGRNSSDDWSELDRIRFRGMVSTGATTLVLALLPYPFISVGLSDPEIWGWSSAIGGVLALVPNLTDLPRVRRARLWSNPEVSKPTMAFGLLAGLGAPSLLMLNASGLVFGPTFTPYLVALLAIFGASLMSFIRVLADVFAANDQAA